MLKPLSGPGGRWATEHLEKDIVGWLTTVAADGRVQSSPVSFLWDGRTVLFYSQPNAPKMRNIGAHPEVSFHLDTDPYGDHALIIEGIAAVDSYAPPWQANGPFAEKFREPLDHWHLDEAETSRDLSAAVRIIPTRIRAW